MTKKCIELLGLGLTVFSVNAFALSQTVEMRGSCSAFEVRLPANPTTGYQWTIEQFDRERFNFVQDTYIASQTTRMGAPGEHVFYFERKIDTICPEETSLCFSYSRAWEKKSGDCTRVTVHFSN